MAWLLAVFIGGAVSLLAAAGYFLVVNAATVAAEKKAVEVAPSTIVDRLLTNKEFKAMVGQSATSVPAGAIVAFSTRCPTGWSEFELARGRTIIGAGQGQDLSDRKLGVVGGEETHVLMINEIPQHSHQVRAATFANDAVERFPATGSFGIAHQTIVSAETGGRQPHNNMPPYIPLYFCKKGLAQE